MSVRFELAQKTDKNELNCSLLVKFGKQFSFTRRMVYPGRWTRFGLPGGKMRISAKAAVEQLIVAYFACAIRVIVFINVHLGERFNEIGRACCHAYRFSQCGGEIGMYR